MRPLQSQNFNTSHVVVYRREKVRMKQQKKISIHLMLQFITLVSTVTGSVIYFNTSHVVVYPFLINRLKSNLYYFNTSHVVVYLAFTTYALSQYTDFNTSHVVVYPCPCERKRTGIQISIHLMLQFITCSVCSITLYSKFQYISCCSLSSPHVGIAIRSGDFNTSHVVVYRKLHHK